MASTASIGRCHSQWNYKFLLFWSDYGGAIIVQIEALCSKENADWISWISLVGPIAKCLWCFYSYFKFLRPNNFLITLNALRRNRFDSTKSLKCLLEAREPLYSLTWRLLLKITLFNSRLSAGNFWNSEVYFCKNLLVTFWLLRDTAVRKPKVSSVLNRSWTYGTPFNSGLHWRPFRRKQESRW